MRIGLKHQKNPKDETLIGSFKIGGKSLRIGLIFQNHHKD
jgi:hypothetical protein